MITEAPVNVGRYGAYTRTGTYFRLGSLVRRSRPPEIGTADPAYSNAPTCTDILQEWIVSYHWIVLSVSGFPSIALQLATSKAGTLDNRRF